MGIAFLMNGLSFISCFIMTIVPLSLSLIFLVFAQALAWRSREFWFRGCVAIALVSVVLSVFLWPYYRVHVLYGLKWQPWEYAFNSASVIHWFMGGPRNKVW